MEHEKPIPGTRVRYFPSVWDENNFHDGTVIDDEGNIEFDDGFQLTQKSKESAAFVLSESGLKEIGIDFDAPSNQFTMRKAPLDADYIALALAENRMQIAYEVKSGELVWLQKDDGETEFAAAEKMKGYKFAGDPSLPPAVQMKMMNLLAQVATYVAEHGLKKDSQ